MAQGLPSPSKAAPAAVLMRDVPSIGRISGMTNDNERRCSERAAVMLSATLSNAPAAPRSAMSNLSSEGAAVVGAPLAALFEGGAAPRRKDIASRVVWVDGRFCGLRFEQPTAIDSMLPTSNRATAGASSPPGAPGP